MEGPDAVGAILGQLEGFEAPASAWETESFPTESANTSPPGSTNNASRDAMSGLGWHGGKATPNEPPHPSAVHQSCFSRDVTHASGPRYRARSKRRTCPLGRKPSPTTSECTEPLSSTKSPTAPAFYPLRWKKPWRSSWPWASSTPTASAACARCRSPRIAAAPLQVAAVNDVSPCSAWTPPDDGPSCGSQHLIEADADDRPTEQLRDEEAIEHVARTLLKRWGVVFWRMLAREADWLPPWRDLLMCYGAWKHAAKFAVAASSQASQANNTLHPKPSGCCVTHAVSLTHSPTYLSGADPLNLVGILTPGSRLPSLSGNRILYRDGIPVAVFAGSEVTFLEKLEPKEQWDAQNLLLRRHVPAVLADLA